MQRTELSASDVAALGGGDAKDRVVAELLEALQLAERELRLTNLTDDGRQRPNTQAARALTVIRAAIEKATK